MPPPRNQRSRVAHPWSQGYWEKLKPRLDALFATY
jgi:hypothetical protein